jgi:hypothetical protein
MKPGALRDRLPPEDQRKDPLPAAEMMVVMMIAAIIVAPVVVPMIAIVGMVTIPVRVTPVAPVTMFVAVPPVVVATMIAGLRLRRENREAEQCRAEDGDGFEVHNVVPTPTRGFAENSYECVIFQPRGNSAPHAHGAKHCDTAVG